MTPLPVPNDSKHLFISRQHSMSNANATSASRLGEVPRYVHRHVVSADAERGQNGFVCREPMFKSHQNISKVATSVSVQFSSCVCSILWSL